MSEERVSSDDSWLHFTMWMTLFSPAVSKLILSPSPSHLKDVGATLTLVLPTFMFIFLLPVGTKTGFQVLIQKKRKFTINRNREYTEPSDCFLYLHRTLLFLFTWHTFACLSIVVLIYWGILDFWHYFADSAFEEGFAHLFVWCLISRMLWPWLSLLGTTVIQTADQ